MSTGQNSDGRPAGDAGAFAASTPQLRLVVDSGVAVVTLDRPSTFNAIDLPMAQALAAAVEALHADPAVRAVVLCGAGRSFCGGGDVKAMQAHAHDLPAFIAQVIDVFHVAVLGLARLPVPLVVAVQGAAAGGGFSLAMAGDVVVAGRGARFVVAYPQLGTSTDGGLSWHLQQRLGPARALAMLTMAGPLMAVDAHAQHLVQHLVDDDSVQAEALRHAQALAALPAQGVRELKALVRGPSLDALATQLTRERAAFLRCAATPDFAARVAAFAARKAAA